MCMSVNAQDSSHWLILAKVNYEKPQFISRGFETREPIFSQEVKNTEGKEVTLAGYIYPLKGQKASNHFVLSALPISSCFFCGQGGPETVVEVHAKRPVSYSSSKIVMKGILRLHRSDPLGLIYSLEEAVWIK